MYNLCSICSWFKNEKNFTAYTSRFLDNFAEMGMTMGHVVSFITKDDEKDRDQKSWQKQKPFWSGSAILAVFVEIFNSLYPLCAAYHLLVTLHTNGQSHQVFFLEFSNLSTQGAGCVCCAFRRSPSDNNFSWDNFTFFAPGVSSGTLATRASRTQFGSRWCRWEPISYCFQW